MRRAVAALAGAWLIAAPFPAAAHSFGALYTLPVPVWMYVYGATAALALSFLMIGWFVTTPVDANRNFRVSDWKALKAPLALEDLRMLSVALLLLSIVSGLVGSSNSYSNFNMTFFWIVILLGYTYWTALLGNSYDALNPWRAITMALEGVRPGAFAGRRAYPSSLAYTPALLSYVALVWLELFGHTGPLSLALSQGPRIFRLVSDPFGYRWNLFGTRHWFDSPILLGADTIWHLQVALILFGHVVSVCLSHLVALRLFPSARAAVISQLPLLALMMLVTGSGWWILSLPIQAGA